MDRMQSMKKAVLILAIVFLCVCSSAAKEDKDKAGTTRRPNILLIIGDDIGIGRDNRYVSGPD